MKNVISKRLSLMLASLILVLPYLGAVLGNLGSEVRRIFRSECYTYASADVLSERSSGEGKYKRTYLTLKIGKREVECRRSDLEPVGAIPFLFPTPKVGDHINVYTDGAIVSGGTARFAALSILVKVALIAWIVFVLRLGFVSAARSR